MRALVLGIAVAATACKTTCKTTTLTAQYSVVPVLLGPVQRLGGGTDARSPDGTFETALEDTTVATGGADGSSSSFRSRSAATQVDWDVLVSTNGQEGGAIVIRSFHCVGYSFFGVVAVVAKSRCALGGDVLPAPRRLRSRRPKHFAARERSAWYCFESRLGSRCTRTKQSCEAIAERAGEPVACKPAPIAYCLPSTRFGPSHPDGICVPALATCQASASHIPHGDGTPMSPAECVETR